MRYLTPDRYRVMGSGVDLTGVPDTHLASILSRACDMVDAYCNVPSLPQRYDFRGGTITDETHPFFKDTIRVFPRHRPVRSILAFHVYATNNVYIDIDPGDIFVEPRGGWAEIVALSMSPVGFWAATDLVSLTNPVLRLDYTYGYRFTVRGEMLVTDNDATYRAQNQFWDESEDITVYVDGSEVTSGVTTNAALGTVTFDTPLTPDNVVTVDYTHTLPPGIAQAVALVADSMINERALVGKGLGNLAEIQVEEVRLRRDARRTGTLVVAAAVPDTARALLAPYRFVSVA